MHPILPMVPSRKIASASVSLSLPIFISFRPEISTTNDLDGTGRMRRDRMRNRAEQEVHKPAVTMRSERDQIGAPHLRRLDDRLRRMACDDFARQYQRRLP